MKNYKKSNLKSSRSALIKLRTNPIELSLNNIPQLDLPEIHSILEELTDNDEKVFLFIKNSNKWEFLYGANL